MLYQDNPKLQILLEELFQQVTVWYNSTGDAKVCNAEKVEKALIDILQCQVDIEKESYLKK